MSDVKLIPLGQIPWEECFAFQCREQMDRDHIAQLRERIEESDEEQQQKGLPLRLDLFPPLTVFTRGGLADLYYLADGFHRYEALLQANRDAYQMEVHVVDDPLFAAREHSLKANSSHGLKRDAATCQRVFMKARGMFPDIDIYGPRGIEGKTGLSRGFLYRQLKRLKEAGTPDTHVILPLKRSRGDTQTSPAPSEPPSKTTLSERTQRTDAPAKPGSGLPDEPESTSLAGSTTESVGGIGLRPHAVDKLGRAIPPSLRSKFNAPEVNELIRKIGMLLAEIDDLAGTPGWEYLDAAGVSRSMKKVQQSIRSAEYHSACPGCEGIQNCRLCRGAGFITSAQHARLAEQENAVLNW